ncbi:hypothetical protein BT96DRAFT_983443 [Gymnopus androsaceus JB14]|uniref:REJ domain-containing protein n=1 Tax=Gymnopus androsaceus JB14 TaxID=1447944 RepID=A0A6A4IQB7_9AGAR|nr:hypothetical protein BT96DRAFT_983443 [Gymnopus androsaceus JB14]
MLVRNGLLENRAFGIGTDGVGDLGSDIIGTVLSGLFPTPTARGHTSSSTTTSSSSSSSITSSITSSLTSSNSVASVALSTSATSTSSSTTVVQSSSLTSSASSSASSSISVTTSPSSSSTADASEATPSSTTTSSAGNIIGGVAAALIALISLCVFGFFFLRQRRKRRSERKLLHQVDPFTVTPDDQLQPPRNMTEQRMTFGALYGRPGPSYPEGDRYQQISPSVLPYPPPSTIYANNTSRSLTSPFADPIPASASPISPIGFSPLSQSSFAAEYPASPFADPVVSAAGGTSASPNPIFRSSLIIQTPPSAAVKLFPSNRASGGDGLSSSGYSPVMRNAEAPSTPSPTASESRPATVYHEDDAYAGI